MCGNQILLHSMIPSNIYCIVTLVETSSTSFAYIVQDIFRSWQLIYSTLLEFYTGFELGGNSSVHIWVTGTSAREACRELVVQQWLESAPKALLLHSKQCKTKWNCVTPCVVISRQSNLPKWTPDCWTGLSMQTDAWSMYVCMFLCMSPTHITVSRL